MIHPLWGESEFRGGHGACHGELSAEGDPLWGESEFRGGHGACHGELSAERKVSSSSGLFF